MDGNDIAGRAWIGVSSAKENATMRFMILLKGDPAPGQMPDPELINAMIRYNEELAKAGVLLAAEGLLDSSKGTRVIYSAGQRRVMDGPFTEAKELVAGFYLIQVKSKEEAVEWAKRCPVEYAVKERDVEAVVEIRQVGEPEDIKTMTKEQRAAEQQLREQISGS
jgi:hypothetical protein